MNYWYSAQPFEIFLDLDSNRAVARALSVLRVAIRQKKLPIRKVWLYATETKGHAHMVIMLKQEMSIDERLAWSLWLGNDRLRVAYVLQRYHTLAPEKDLLVSKWRYYRPPDAFCTCKGKHKEKKVTDACPAMTHLLGLEASADYFARTGSAPPRKKIRVPWGEVSLTQLRQWKEVYE